jgi:RIO kinase 1
LRNVRLEEPEEVYHSILSSIEQLFNRAQLVHADLSEFNILMGDQPYLIDMGQSVILDHPRAMTFLVRDIRNINRFFAKLCDIREDREIFQDIVGTERMEF